MKNKVVIHSEEVIPYFPTQSKMPILTNISRTIQMNYFIPRIDGISDDLTVKKQSVNYLWITDNKDGRLHRFKINYK